MSCAMALTLGATAHAGPFGDHSKDSAAAIASGDYVAGVLAFEDELRGGLPASGKAAKKLLANKTFASGLVAQASAAATADRRSVIRASEAVALALSGGALKPEEAEQPLTALRQAYVAGVKSGAFDGVLDDPAALRSTAPDTPFEKALLINTARAMGDDQISPDEFDRLLSYAKARPSSTELLEQLGQSLPTLQFSVSALKRGVNAEYPDFAKAELRKRVAKINLKVGGDALFGLDLRDALGRVETVEVVFDESEADAVILLDQLALVIAPRPMETTTVRYSQYEVNFLASALLMPRNATYQYEVSSGGSEFEYAFNVDVRSGAFQVKPFVIRDRGATMFAKCSGQRVVNVFGGSEPASFVANNDQRSRCEGGDEASVSDLRRRIASQVADRLAEKVSMARGTASAERTAPTGTTTREPNAAQPSRSGASG